MSKHNPFCPAFDTTGCPRCNAPGQLTTTTIVRQPKCCKCSGTGRVLSRRGKMAREYMRNKLLVPARLVKRGDVVWFYTEHFTEGAQVERVEHQGTAVIIYGQRAGTRQMMVAEQKNTDLVQWAYSPDQLLAIRAEVEAYQAGLTKAGQPRKQPEKLAA